MLKFVKNKKKINEAVPKDYRQFITIETPEKDTIEKIMQRYRVDLETLIKHNPFVKHLEVSDELPKGTELKLPKDWHPKYTTQANFKKDWIETKIISKVSTWCWGTLPIVDLIQIRAGAGARKGTYICGFSFKSALNDELPEFKLVFCPKPRSKIYRADNPKSKIFRSDKPLYSGDPEDDDNASGKLADTRPRWYTMQVTKHATEFNILSKDVVYKLYGFDIDRFFASPEFEICCKKWASDIEKGRKSAGEYVSKYKQMIKKRTMKSKEDRHPEDDGNIDEWLTAIDRALKLIKTCDTAYEDKNYFFHDEQKILNMMSALDRKEISKSGAEMTQQVRDKAGVVMKTIASIPKYTSGTIGYN